MISKETIDQAKVFAKQHLSYFALVGGFLFDVLTLDRIDRLWILLQQTSFLGVVFVLLYFYERDELRSAWNIKIQKLWRYHDFVLQFIMGSLLSAYTIFYFKSSSSWAIVAFVSVLLLLLFLNEKKNLHQNPLPIRYAMVSLAICSFLIYAVPIFLGSISGWVFLLSMLLSLLVYFLWMRVLIKPSQWKSKQALGKILAGMAVPLLLTGLYLCKLIPPVPLAITKMGIYHQVEKEDDAYILYFNRPMFRFWENGDQTFYAKEGDRVHFFVSVFAPTDFTHQIFVRWQQSIENQGWQTSDVIPINIVGGRDEGFRGVTYKDHYSLGQWRILVETEDQRELGRIRLHIKEDERKKRKMKTEVF